MVTQPDWTEILTQCRDSIKAAIAPLLKTLNEPQPDLGVGAGGDPKRQADLAAETAIVNTLLTHVTSFTLISEESGIREYGPKAHECFVTTDPVDGSTNLMRGIPFYATSIAISTRPVIGTIHAALVADLFHGTTYVAEKGKGAYRDGEKARPSDVESLAEAVIGMDLNTYKVQELIPRLLDIVKKTKHLRHLGANALELCYVADGTTDAFIDIRGKLRTTDMAAAWLVINEAGARITTPEGRPLRVSLDPKQTVSFVAAGNRSMHRTLLDLITSEKEAA